MILTPDNTIKEAKKYLRENFKEGCKCLVCDQVVKLYSRPITSSMAYGLALMYKWDRENNKSGMNPYCHIEDHFKALDIPSSIRGDFSKLRFFGLVEAKYGKRKDKSGRNGFYRITGKGKQFVAGIVEVSDHVYLYNNTLHGFSDTKINFRKALNNKFNYDKLMKDIL